VDWARQLADALRRDELYTLKEIDWGFMRPKKVGGRLQAYAQSEWMCEYLIETCGPDVLNRMLAAFAAKRTQAEVFAEVVGLAEGEFDQRFAAWARQQAKPWGFDLSPPEEVAPLSNGLQPIRTTRICAPGWPGPTPMPVTGSWRKKRSRRASSATRSTGWDWSCACAGWLFGWPLPVCRRRGASCSQKRNRSPAGCTLWTRTTATRSPCWPGSTLEREEPDQAVPLLERLREVWPMGMFAVETLAKIHYDAGRFEEALPLLDIVAQQRQSHPDTWRRMGDIHERAGRLDAARTAYDRGLFIDPLDEQLHLSLAEIAMRQRDWPNAVTAYRTLCKIAPRSADYHSRCALAYRALGDNKNMREFAERAVRIDPAASAAVLLED
jgi:tetratricopeptide (TPR) repeat protein